MNFLEMLPICDLERNRSQNYIHMMTVIADQHRRITLPENFKPGDAFDLEEKNGNSVVLTKLAEPERPKVRLIREGGLLLATNGQRITQEEVRKAMDEFP